MNRTARNVVLGLVLLPLVLVTLVNSLAIAPEQAPPDPAMLITMPDGAQVPLAEVVEAARPDRGVEVPAGPAPTPEPGASSPDEDPQTDAAAVEAEVLEVLEELRAGRDRPPRSDDLLGLANHARRNGRPEEALALYLSIQPDDHDYPRAQRAVGWDLYTRELHQPERGVSHVNASVLADPFDGNAWQDAARVYGRSLGLPID